MHTAAPIAWQMMNGELAKPVTQTGTTTEVDSGDDSDHSSDDTDSSTDHVAPSVKLELTQESKTDMELAAENAAAGVQDMLGAMDAPDDGKPRDDNGRFKPAAVASAQAAEGEQIDEPQQESADDMGARERQEAFNAGMESMKKVAEAAAKARTAKRAARKAKREASQQAETKSAKQKSDGVKFLVRQAKDVMALSRSLITVPAYASLSHSLRVALWSHNSNIIWGRLRAALGDEHSYLIARMTTRDGVTAWAIVNRRHSESSAASETHYLQLFLTQKLEKSAKGGEQPSMRSYFEKLSELAELYSQSRVDNKTIEEHLWRMKALDLPPYYSDAVTALEIADAEARSRGEPVRSSSAIADYVTDFETRRRRKRELRIAESGGRHRHGQHSRRSRSEPRRRDRNRHGRAFFATPPAATRPSTGRGHRQHGGRGRGRGAGRGRGGKFAGTCFSCGKVGHRASECRSAPASGTKFTGTCYSCGKVGHRASECRSAPASGNAGHKPKSLRPNFGFVAAGGAQRQANNARRNKGKKRAPNGGSHPPAQYGFALWEDRAPGPHAPAGDGGGGYPDCVYTVRPVSDRVMVLDSGASHHYCSETFQLERVRPCRRVIRAANGGRLSGVHQGDAGPLRSCVGVRGLVTNLASVGALAAESDVACVFTAVGAFLLPAGAIAAMLTDRVCVGHRNVRSGLYDTTPERIGLVVDRLPGRRALPFRSPHVSRGLLATADGLGDVPAVRSGSSLIPPAAFPAAERAVCAPDAVPPLCDLGPAGGDWDEHGKLSDSWGSDALSGSPLDPDSGSSIVSPRLLTRSPSGDFLNAVREQELLQLQQQRGMINFDQSTGTPSPAAATAALSDFLAKENDVISSMAANNHTVEPTTQMPTVADICSSVGGFTMAAESIGWEPVVSVDHCIAVRDWHYRNHSHKFIWADVTDPPQRTHVCRQIAGVTVIVCSPPCGPYSSAGRRKQGDERGKVAEACVDIVIRTRPQLMVMESVRGFVSSKTCPVYQQTVLPALTNNGYSVVVVRSDAAQCGVPSSRHREWVIATLYQTDDSLKRHFQELKQQRRTTLVEWFPSLAVGPQPLVRSFPCRTGPGIIDPTKGPMPAQRTASFSLLKEEGYEARPGDAGPISMSRELTVDQRIKLTGLPETFEMPPITMRCTGRCCLNPNMKGRQPFPILSVWCGNIVCVAQGAEVLKHCGLPTDEEAGEHAMVRPRGARHAMLVQMPEHLIEDNAMRLHVRMGHASRQKMIDMIQRGGISDVTVKEVKSMPEHCPICTMSKLKSGPHKKSIINRPRAVRFNARVHTDTMTRRWASMQRNIYIQMSCDEATRWASCEFMANRRQEAYQATLRRMESKLHAISRGTHEALNTPGCSGGFPIGTWVSDNAGEMVSRSNRDRMLFSKPPIALETTVATAHAHAGIIERLNASILSLVRGLLLSSGLGIKYWQWAVRHAVYLYNRRPHNSNPDGKSPYEMLYNTTPRYDKMRTWGCVVYTFVPQTGRPNRSKVDPSAQPRIYVGVPDSGIGHMVHNVATDRTTHRWSCIFDETRRGIDGSPIGQVPWPKTSEKEASFEPTGETTEEDTDSEPEVHPASFEVDGDEISGSGSERNSESDSEVDTWNTEYKAIENETMADIAFNHKISVESLISHNLDLPGCARDTRQVTPHAPLMAGTGVWLPDPETTDSGEGAMALRVYQNPCLGDFIRPGSKVDEQWKRECELEDIGEKLYDDVYGNGGIPVEIRNSSSRRSRSNAFEDSALPQTGKELAGVLTEDAPDSWEEYDGPAGMVLCIMNAATQLVRHVSIHADKKSKEEIALHAERVVSAAEDTFERAYTLHQMEEAASKPSVLPGTEGTKARDLIAPKNFNAAMKGKFAQLWQDSIAAEIANLNENAVYSWVDKPANARCIGVTWAFKTKSTPDGYVSQLKSRVCALGYLQTRGIDFLQSYAPVSTMVTWRCMVAEASRKSWVVDVVDIKSAFLQSELEPGCVVYVRPPKGVTPPKPGQVWMLRKALYGLRQAAYVWNMKLDRILTGMSFRRSVNDQCLYVWNHPSGHIIRLTIHVDDLCIVSNSVEWYTRFRNKLSEHFDITSPSKGNTSTYLGIAMTRLDDGSLQLSQGQYCRDLLARYNMTGCKPVNTPWQPGVRLGKEQSPTTEEERLDMAKVPYLAAIGSLLWLAGGTRPDISYCVSHLARYSSNPGRAHWKQVRYLMRYLAGTQDLGIIYGRKVEGIPFNPLCAASDASWADGADQRSSCSGWILFSAGGPISWSSTRMKAIALSTTEAEYHALCQAGREVVFVKRVLEIDCGYTNLSVRAHNDLAPNTFDGKKTTPVTILEDNTGAIALAGKRGSHKRSKHIDLQFHWIQQKVQEGQLLPVYVESALNPADLLTKGVSRETLLRLRPMMLWPHEKNAHEATCKDYKVP
jgi:hypothetical protein